MLIDSSADIEGLLLLLQDTFQISLPIQVSWGNKWGINREMIKTMLQPNSMPDCILMAAIWNFDWLTEGEGELRRTEIAGECKILERTLGLLWVFSSGMCDRQLDIIRHWKPWIWKLQETQRYLVRRDTQPTLWLTVLHPSISVFFKCKVVWCVSWGNWPTSRYFEALLGTLRHF